MYLWATSLVIANTVWVALNLFGLPGNWLMVITTALVAWWQWDHQMINIWTVVAITILASLAELLEFIAGLFGAKRAGGSRYGTIGALVGGVVGAIAGTALIPVPVLGTLIGACGGGFVGAAGLELAGGRPMDESVRSGIGAGVGRLVGTAIKLGAGIVIWLIVAIAAFWP